MSSLFLPSLDSYGLATLLALGRLVLGAILLYGVAWMLFPLRAPLGTAASLAERRWIQGLLGVALATGLVHGLVLLRMYDGLMLVGCLLLMMIAVLWSRHNHGRGTVLYVRFLDRLDRIRSVRSLWKKSRAGTSSVPRLVGVVLTGLVVGSVTLRLLPLLSSPAPSSLLYYRLLEGAKHLQANQLFPGHLVDTRGLQSLTVALHALTDVEMGLVVRLLGVLTALFILLGIYAATRGATGDGIAALGASGLFGLGLPLLPFAIENQVEASPVLLAVAYALPTWYVFLRYLNNGMASYLGVGTAGVALLLLTNGTVAALVLALLAALGALQSVWHPRRGLIVTGLSAGGGLFLGGTTLLRRSVVVPDLFGVPLFSVVGSIPAFHSPAFSASAYGLVVGTIAVCLLVSAVTDQHPFRRFVSGALALTCVGLYAAWTQSAMLPVALSPMAAPALLSVFLSVGFGLLVAHAARLVRTALRSRPSRPALRPLYFTSMSGLLLIGIFASPLPSIPVLDRPTEPGGYVRAIHAIQRAADPYQWTVVSHHGTAVHAMNRGRFLSYDYFLHNYDARTYDPAGEEAIPTTDLFLFVPTDSTAHLVRDELLAANRETTRSMQRWCETYRQRRDALPVFYADDHLTVYRITRPPTRRQIPAPLSSFSLPAYAQ